MSNINKNEQGWLDLFEKHNIAEKIQTTGSFEISATEIKKGSGREARLMAKFDSSSNLPKIFAKNKISILPITRGSYILAPVEAYHNLTPAINNKPINYIQFPDYIESINPENITSESTALNSAYISGIIHHFVGDDNIVPTVSGRMASNNFDFNITNLITKRPFAISVKNSQIEIDAGYEGVETLSLIEAKNNISADFLIRQLYYPFRKYQDQIAKKIKPIYLIYTNNVFYLYEYSFEDPLNYNSLILKNYERYSFEKLNITLSDIKSLIYKTQTIEEPKAPFPQADSFLRVINLCELLLNSTTTKEDITSNYDFDKRQTDYYYNAGKYLGLFKQVEKEIKLTTMAQNILKLPARAKQLAFAELIIKHKVFKDALIEYLNTLQQPTKSKIIELMKLSNLYNITEEKTFERRSSTIISWVDWVLNLVND